MLKLEYVVDNARTGRPLKVTPELEEKIVADLLGKGGKTNKQVAAEDGVGATAILRIKKKHEHEHELSLRGEGRQRKSGGGGESHASPYGHGSHPAAAIKSQTFDHGHYWTHMPDLWR